MCADIVHLFLLCFFFFFFQAEDGIRDDLVTGVQTCALPISITSGITMLSGTSVVTSISMPPAGAGLGMVKAIASCAPWRCTAAEGVTWQVMAPRRTGPTSRSVPKPLTLHLYARPGVAARSQQS